ncbi:calpain-1 catalytic subunit-like [Paramormyrops kingsleyae]|uniref:calpain-1 catalytic subunit-like n=1 Tax=Paramormyrops kingsleyae TaxID=1676925 RepID=UPI003B9781AC
MPPPGVCLNIIKDRNQERGMGTVTDPVKFRGQDFYWLRDQFLKNRQRFIDGTFPPDSSIIGPKLLKPEDMARVEWKRPHKMVASPCLFVDGVSRFDIAQGCLGDCWFLASVGALTFQPQMLQKVVPNDQGFHRDYAGIFHFRFWRFGAWVDVVIDDKLPTIDGNLIFVHPTTKNEFWAALLEKAYAKVCGSYSDLKAGNVSEAMMDFTGGIHVMYMLKEAPPNLWDLMNRAVKFKSLMGCGTAQGATPENVELPNGIVQGHAYAITGVAQVMSHGRPVNLVRIWNPWGRGEWNGDWSDRSSSWNTVTVEDRTSCLQICDNGEFWMSMMDFTMNFEDVDICCCTPEFLDDSPSQWGSSCHSGKWVAGTTAGGYIKFRETFWMNPQYQVRVTCGTKGSDHPDSTNMVVSLLQKPDNGSRSLSPNHYIGFTLFAVPPELRDAKGKFPASFFNSSSPISVTKAFMNVRETTQVFFLPPGEFVIVPSTFNPEETASFLLMIFSKMQTSVGDSSAENHMTINKKIYSDYAPTEHESVFAPYSDKLKEVDAEQLQKLLNENVVTDMSSGGFGLEMCRSIVAMMDLSVTGTLKNAEFSRLWKRVQAYKDVFIRKDVSRTGKLSLQELRNAIQTAGVTVSDDLLNLVALRHGSSSREITLESFIFLMLRLHSLNKIFKNLSDGKGMYLKEKEWLYLNIYS